MTAKREIITWMVSRLAFKLCQWIPCPSLNEDPTHPNLNNDFTHLTILRCTGIWMRICEYSMSNNLEWILTISRYSRLGVETSSTSHISVTQMLIGGSQEYMLINAKCEIINILMVSRLAFKLYHRIPCLSLSEDPAHRDPRCFQGFQRRKKPFKALFLVATKTSCAVCILFLMSFRRLGCSHLCLLRQLESYHG